MSDIDTKNETTPLGLNKPLVGGDDDLWGDLLNANADLLDALITALQGRTINVDGVSIIGSGAITDPLTVDRIDGGSYTTLLGHRWQLQAAAASDAQRSNRVLHQRQGPR